MRKFVMMAAAVSLSVSLGACNKAGDDAAKTDDAAATTADAGDAAAKPADAAAAAPAAGSAPTKEFVVGKWAEEGQCGSMAIEFKADGSMVGPADKWELDNGELTFVGMPQKMVLKVVDDKTMESSLDGKEAPRKLVRC